MSLEPCIHYGNTKPCVDQIIASGISKVMISVLDPNPLVSGKGVRLLRKHGIAVSTGILRKEGVAINEVFFHYQKKHLPWVSLKLAQTVDGRIALKNGHSKWITSDKSRIYAHKLRAYHQAILTTSNTVLADNSSLTVRFSKGQNPIRILLDRDLKVPLSSNIFDDSGKTLLVTSTKNEKRREVDALLKKKTRVIFIHEKNHVLPIKYVLKSLAEEGISNILVEAGGKLAGAILDEELANVLYVFIAPKFLGEKSLPSVVGINHPNIDQTFYMIRDIKKLGNDILLEYEFNKGRKGYHIQ